MSTCLRCDNCDSVIDASDDALKKWWRLERYGQDWVDDPHRMVPAIPAFMQHMVMGEISFDPDDDDVMFFPPEIVDDMADEPSDVSLHFCKSQCLCDWAAQASALEG